MSAKPWSTVAAPPYGFLVTIERRLDGVREEHTFARRISNRSAAIQSATYKKGFLRVVKCDPLTREEWDRK